MLSLRSRRQERKGRPSTQREPHTPPGGNGVGGNEEFRPSEHHGSEPPPGGQALDQACDVGLSSARGGLSLGILTACAGGWEPWQTLKPGDDIDLYFIFFFF